MTSTFLEIAIANTLVAAIPAALALLAARLGARPQLVHALWVLVLLKLVTPPLIPLELVELAAPESAPISAPATAAPLPAAPADVPAPATTPPRAAPVRSAPAGVTPARPPVGQPAVTTTALDPTSTPIWLLLALAGWGIGAAWTLVAAARRSRELRVLVEAAPRPDASVARQVRALGERLGLKRLPDVRVVPGNVSPMLWATFGRTWLILPERLLPRLDRKQLVTLLAHELVHYRRGDHQLRWLELAVRAAHWWNPFARLSCRALRTCEEHCCDAHVVATLPAAPRHYAQALLTTVDFLIEAPSRLPQTASGAGSARNLNRRLTMIFSSDPAATTRGNSLRGSFGSRIAVAALAALTLPLVPTVAQSKTSKDGDLARVEQRLEAIHARHRALAERLHGIEETHGEKAAKQVESRLADLDARRADILAAIEAARAGQADAQDPKRKSKGKSKDKNKGKAERQRQKAIETAIKALERADRGDEARALREMLDDVRGSQGQAKSKTGKARSKTLRVESGQGIAGDVERMLEDVHAALDPEMFAQIGEAVEQALSEAGIDEAELEAVIPEVQEAMQEAHEAMHEAHDEIRAAMKEVHEEIAQAMAEVHDEIHGEIAEVMSEVHDEVQEALAEAHSELTEAFEGEDLKDLGAQINELIQGELGKHMGELHKHLGQHGARGHGFDVEKHVAEIQKHAREHAKKAEKLAREHAKKAAKDAEKAAERAEKQARKDRDPGDAEVDRLRDEIAELKAVVRDLQKQLSTGGERRRRR